jgi:hypothetical protein
MPKSKVFLDTNVFKFSAVDLPRLHPREVTIHWGGREQPYIVQDLIMLNPNYSLKEESRELKAEAELLPEVAALAASGFVVFQITNEVRVELANIPNLDSASGDFLGLPARVYRLRCRTAGSCSAESIRILNGRNMNFCAP